MFTKKVKSKYFLVEAGKTYTGINIQWPASAIIMTGKKTVETRIYPLSQSLIGKELILVETPGDAKNGGCFGEVGKQPEKRRMVALIVFGENIHYANKKEFYADKRHLITPDSPWRWNDKPKWGWLITSLKVFDKPIPLTKNIGIKTTNGLTLPPNIKMRTVV